MVNERIIHAAFASLLNKLFGGNVPRDYQKRKVHGAFFDKCRREVEREFRLHEDERLYTEWFVHLMFNSPLFLTEEELQKCNHK